MKRKTPGKGPGPGRGKSAKTSSAPPSSKVKAPPYPTPFEPPGGGRSCKTEARRAEIRRRGGNGLDYLEVDDSQTELCVHFLGHIPDGITAENVRLRGGRCVRVESVAVHHAEDREKDDCLAIRLAAPGDFSTYELCLVEVDEQGHETGRPFPGLDPRYACLSFTFKVGCPSDLDCLASPPCPEPPRREPDVDYLAKDFGSFGRLLTDRLSLLTPSWKERHAPDVGVTLVELLAYAGDDLSYAQDAVATEAYLGTARRRVSVRRHARLVDYVLHEGCNARAWLAVKAAADAPLDLADVLFVTRVEELAKAPVLTEVELDRVASERYEAFEPFVPGPAGSLALAMAHNEISIYAWGDRECCLPRGATSATLVDGWVDVPAASPDLRPGDQKTPPDDGPATRPRKLRLKRCDFLLFEEVLGPDTADPADADPTHRHVVRLTRVTPSVDPLSGQPVLEVEWGDADALPFPLCVSSLGPPPACAYLPDVSVARGNVLLVDHGRRRSDPLGPVPVVVTDPPCVCEGRTGDVAPGAGAFEPRLPRGPVTWADRPAPCSPASVLFRRDVRGTNPAVELIETAPPAWRWEPRPDLLESDGYERHFVVEVDDLGLAHLRFGDGELGRRPTAGATFAASYRVGNGYSGNVGAETIAHLVFRKNPTAGLVEGVRNPLPAMGGTDPESLDEARLRAPHAFRRQLQRAVTADDYARIAERSAKVQRAAAALRWNGSWYEMTVGVDALGKEAADPALLVEIDGDLHPFRRIGHDLRVRRASAVPIRLALRICVKPHYLRGHVEAELLDVLSNRDLGGGRRGLFHPDELTFGEGVALSRVVAAAQAVTGVASVEVTAFERQLEGPHQELRDSFLPLGPFEIARLDNDPRAPGNGVLTLDMRGGR